MIPFYYGILVIGPSGAGKTTLCAGLKQMMTSIGRKCCAINLDPANENDPPGLFDVNIMRLITVEDVMKEFRLGYPPQFTVAPTAPYSTASSSSRRTYNGFSTQFYSFKTFI